MALPSPLLAVDLNLSIEDYRWLFGLLGESVSGALSNTRTLETLFDAYPLVFIAALTGTPLLESKESFWDSFWDLLGTGPSPHLYTVIRTTLRRALRKNRLETFSDSDVSGPNHVSLIRLNAGITPADIEPVVTLIDHLRSEGILTDDPEEFATHAVRYGASEHDGLFNSPLRNLTTHLPVRSADFFARIHEITNWYRNLDDPSEAENFEGTHGLPEPTFDYLLRFLSGDTEVAVREQIAEDDHVTYPNPFLHLNPDTLELVLVFPAISGTVAKHINTPEWSVIMNGSTTRAKQDRDWSYGGFEELRYSLHSPISSLKVVSPSGAEHTIVTSIEAREPVLFFQSSGRFNPSPTSLTGRNTIVIMPAAATITATGPESMSRRVQELGPVFGWRDWVVRTVSLKDVRTLHLEYFTFGRVYPVKESRDVTWLDEESSIRNLQGSDQLPVHHESPKIQVPRDSATWMVRYFQVLPDGGEVPMNDYVVEDHLKGKAFSLFDPADDPWVGRFKVVIFRDSLLREWRMFNLAEGLSVRLSFPSYQKTGKFRVPEPMGFRHSLTRAFIELTSDDDAGLTHPTGQIALADDSRSQKFHLESSAFPETYHLDVYASVPRLQYRLPLRDEVASWTPTFQSFNFNDLFEDDEFQIRFPDTVHEVKLTITETLPNQQIGKSEEISLSRKTGNVWTAPMSRLILPISEAAKYTILACWYPLTQEQYADRHMEEKERRRWRKAPQHKRRDPRGHGALVSLFNVEKQPLLLSAAIEGTAIELVFGRTHSMELEGWAWSIHNPLAPPVEIPITGDSEILPEELLNVGPLIVEVRERKFLEVWSPESPSGHAVIVEHNGALPPLFDPTLKNRWLFARELPHQLLPNEIQTVWDARSKLHHVLSVKENRRIPSIRAFDDATEQFLHRNPRLSLDQLDRSSLPVDGHFEAFIRSGLHTCSFRSAQTGGDIHRVPWIGLIQEMNDLRVLGARAQDSMEIAAERAESEHYIRETGGPVLWKVYSGDIGGLTIVRDHQPTATNVVSVRADSIAGIRQELGIKALGAQYISSNARLAAQLEWLENRRELAGIPRLHELFSTVSDHEYLIDHLEEPELKITALNLSSFAREQHRSDDDYWLFMPYISFVLTLLSRMAAHGVIRTVPTLNELRHVWATAARHVPLLTGFDFVLSEATVLGAIRKHHVPR
ncbi:hypothetical protein [Corynebacterium pacaense]|uniref:hypothetical protein n=1 Tax=Corynebacterium pacaense TaxID=1816684 RepID=UPI0011785F10|nr:hypothetical protein [Corynebacterium pacaense]